MVLAERMRDAHQPCDDQLNVGTEADHDARRRTVSKLQQVPVIIAIFKKGSPNSIAERRVPQLIPVLDSQPAGDVSHKPGGRTPLLSARPAATFATLKRAAINFAAW